jgi:hypothetical protein
MGACGTTSDSSCIALRCSAFVGAYCLFTRGMHAVLSVAGRLQLVLLASSMLSSGWGLVCGRLLGSVLCCIAGKLAWDLC